MAEEISRDRMKVGRRLGDEAVEFVHQHEVEVHDGEPCLEDRVNLIAYLCHRVGLEFDGTELGRAAWEMLVSRAKDYKAMHGEHTVES